MAQVELIMPKMGESVAEATIIKWLKKEGDTIAADETVLEIATDKVDSEIPSTAEGTLVKQLFKEGDVVQVGKAIAIISTDAGTSVAPVSETPAPAASKATVTTSISAQKEAVATPQIPETIDKNSTSGKFLSPLVRTIAKQEGITMAELDSLAGTGVNGRITKNDVLAYLPNKGKGISIQKSQPSVVKEATNGASPKPAVSVNAGDEIIEMDRMRKLIADHMVMSKHTSPHVTSFVEADVTNLVLWREKVKKNFEKREGEKLTFTPIFIDALVKAIKDFPMINVSLDGTKIIKRKNINIGMATALPSGNLIVPVIKNADNLNIVGLSKQVNDLANRARTGKLTPDEVAGGTYTISNVGSFGNVMGTPIINQPQVAIMAVGAIKKKPAVIETPQGDLIGIRHFMYLSHSYDHRIVDGSLGGQFVRRMADYLEQWDVNFEF
ncbi:MAG TPA: dihydrolipoamide acetyltransferase family protein [Bacteroidia bacterium]|jgi:2-oxoglutarate dehydrogenase E2 component (dihydrolipoamide succinyltransferase)|nr:dihydrolipoamide acetyltransferase family protein [Bacteroidia bacterium]